MEEKSREIAKKLLKLGTMSEEEILQVTEISKEQLDKIKETWYYKNYFKNLH